MKNKMKGNIEALLAIILLIVAIVAIFLGLIGGITENYDPNESKENYKCDTEQFAAALLQADVCYEELYFDSFCIVNAMKIHCELEK